MPARSQAADQHAVNPFAARSGIPTFPYCMWEVLIDHPEGLSVSAIVAELQQRGLRDVSGLKNPCGQVGACVVRIKLLLAAPSAQTCSLCRLLTT